MGNGLCPECGCLMEVSEKEYQIGNFDEEPIAEINYECPCCQYTETTYDA